ncbi:MAG: hypothetical protein LC803_01785 [Acidobacteria bacterium]|nr:hypothetical protein [Acidobacteriota bacterium]
MFSSISVTSGSVAIDLHFAQQKIDRARQLFDDGRVHIVINHRAPRPVGLDDVIVKRDFGDQFQVVVAAVGFDRLGVLRAADFVGDAVDAFDA